MARLSLLFGRKWTTFMVRLETLNCNSPKLCFSNTKISPSRFLGALSGPSVSFLALLFYLAHSSLWIVHLCVARALNEEILFCALWFCLFCLYFSGDNNHKLFMRRQSHVSANTVFPELDALTISVWMRTDQTSAGTLLSYATDIRSNEMVIRSHPNFRLTFKNSTSDEFSTALNDGRWHFVCIQWESSTGQWSLFIDNPSEASETFSLGQHNTLEEKGYLVLGRQQEPKKYLIDAEAFLGEIAYFNVWTSKITDINDVKTNCDGFHGGDLVHWSVGSTAPETIDAHHSASIIKADVTGMCEGLCEVRFAIYLITRQNL